MAPAMATRRGEPMAGCSNRSMSNWRSVMGGNVWARAAAGRQVNRTNSAGLTSTAKVDHGRPGAQCRLHPGCLHIRPDRRNRSRMMRSTMGWLFPVILLTAAATAGPAEAIDLGGLANKAAGGVASGAKDKAAKEVNAKLLAEGRKNQCSFKT